MRFQVRGLEWPCQKYDFKDTEIFFMDLYICFVLSCPLQKVARIKFKISWYFMDSIILCTVY